MARPLNPEKKHAILKATIHLIALEGMATSTSKIAKQAGVSEGTIFTYFATKNTLLNEVYLEIKQQLSTIFSAISNESSLKEQVYKIWKSYILWGLTHQDEYQVLATLSLSPLITQEIKTLGGHNFCDISTVLEEVISQGNLSKYSLEYVGALMVAMANTTIQYISIKNKDQSDLIDDAFHAFWLAIS